MMELSKEYKARAKAFYENPNIRYHSNENGPAYDEYGFWSDNWNPFAVYGEKEYTEVHFRIETPLYRHNDREYYRSCGFDTKEDREQFYRMVNGIFSAQGWEKNDKKHSIDDVVKGKQHLFFHPDDISGTVLKNEVKAIAEALREVFKLRQVDLTGTVYDYTDDEYREYLETRARDIRAYILRKARTTRKKFYIASGRIELNAGLCVRRERVGTTDCSGLRGDKVENEITARIVDELIEGGYLVPYYKDGVRYIRTINKTEQRQKKLYIEEAA